MKLFEIDDGERWIVAATSLDQAVEIYRRDAALDAEYEFESREIPEAEARSRMFDDDGAKRCLWDVFVATREPTLIGGSVY